MDEVGVDALLNELIARLGEKFTEVHKGVAELSPARGAFEREGPAPGVIEWMPHRERGESTTIKVVSYSPSNVDDHGLPTITACVARFDDRTGRTMVVADGAALTALRTGAASALASRALAHPDSRTVGLIGCGAQAVTQLHALSLTFPIDTVLAWDVDPAHLASLGRRVEFTGLAVTAARPEEVARSADILVTATSVGIGAGPVFPDSALREHLHVNAVGSDVVGKVELPRTLVDRALVCPDHPEQAAREGESQILDPRRLGPALSELCADAGIVAQARYGPTVFDSTGIALEDHVALDLLVELAAHVGVGTEIDFEDELTDVLNPYAVRRGAVLS
ncbi:MULTISPECIES: ornithine cyclodeaminase family protein [unclassified Micromonospora]|uniref:ornithine cyclodeaminase family protein n=1 Tax=unclassified Micromonospora TaxID=2617518 RepID=UPI0036447E0F